MQLQDFVQYIPVLQQRDFEIYPQPQGIDRSNSKFTYIDHDRTHITV